MPKAEVGSTKYIANKMKAKGLQRLRWYCQICGKQCRDENGFKQHTQSEGHVRAMLLVGEDPRKYINEYSEQFKRDFLQLLRTSHGEKKVHMNHFYQEYIHDKEHVHMNATKWPSLTEFAKYLGREGICRVEEGDKGLEIQWVDDSPEAIRRREDIKRKERLMKGDEDMEARMLERQIRLAGEEAERKGRLEEQKPREGMEVEAVKVSLSLGGKAQQSRQRQEVAREQAPEDPVEISTFSNAAVEVSEQPPSKNSALASLDDEDVAESSSATPAPQASAPPPKLSMSLGGGKMKNTNPLMAKKKNPLSKARTAAAPEPEKKMSNAERIMLEEMERKRKMEERSRPGKRQRVGL